uniref:Si:ch73-364h19.1 n=1 Tax=Astyanax mexicanus TaxID=7994 RepID=A0A3B1JI69_ASTMX
MSTAASHTSSPAAAAAAFPNDQLTIIVASVSCLVFFVVIAVLLSLIFRKDFLCCKVRTYRDSHGDLQEAPSQYYSSRQTLVSSSCAELSSNTMLDSPNSQPPPTYEESIRHSVQSLDVTFETLTSETAPPAQVMNTEPTEHVDDLPQYEELPQNTSN